MKITNLIIDSSVPDNIKLELTLFVKSIIDKIKNSKSFEQFKDLFISKVIDLVLEINYDKTKKSITFFIEKNGLVISCKLVVKKTPLSFVLDKLEFSNLGDIELTSFGL